MKRPGLALLATLVATTARAAAAPDSLEVPGVVAAGEAAEVPVDAGDGDDVTFERAAPDTGAGVEVGFGWRGSGSTSPRRSRSFRFSGEGLDGVVREGGGDPLSGAEIGGAGETGSWRMGRTAPQWGCGWLVGAPRPPWSDAGAEGAFGLRTGPRGDVATFATSGDTRLEAMAGRFAKRNVSAVRAISGPVGIVAAGTPAGFAGAGVTAGGDDLTAELALDRAGRWRAEAAVAREGPAGRLGLRFRSGAPGFRPLLAPTRGGPAQAIGADWTPPGGWLRTRVSTALWRFAPGLGGARGRLEVDLRLAHHAAWKFGVEEQRGTRRETTPGRGLRQGWWGEWRGTSGPLGLTLGLENWGRRSRARDPVRSATVGAIEWRPPFGGWIRAEQRAYRSGSGEGYRAADVEADRVVLRSLTGAGERTRFEWMVPTPAGRMRAGLTLNAAATKPARTQWTLDWTRRTRIGGGAK